jgi:hypothetical protein
MIVQTWCGSRIELTRDRVYPWLHGWFFALLNPRLTWRVRKKRLERGIDGPQKTTFLFFRFPNKDRVLCIPLIGQYSREELRDALQRLRPGAELAGGATFPPDGKAFTEGKCTVH